MAPKVVFYDLDLSQRLELVAKLASAAWERRRTMLIRCRADEVAAIDEHLWTFQEASFLPHEVVRPNQPLKDSDARLLISAHDLKPAKPDLLLELTPCAFEFSQQFATVIHVIDATTPQTLNDSRARYKAWVQSGIKPELKKTV